MGELFAVFTLGVVLGLGIGILLGTSISTGFWHLDTIKRDLAIYCPDTGNWAWVGECEATP